MKTRKARKKTGKAVFIEDFHRTVATFRQLCGGNLRNLRDIESKRRAYTAARLHLLHFIEEKDQNPWDLVLGPLLSFIVAAANVQGNPRLVSAVAQMAWEYRKVLRRMKIAVAA